VFVGALIPVTVMHAILKLENRGADFEVKLQELVDWKEVGVPKLLEPGWERQICLIFERTDKRHTIHYQET